MFLSKISIRSCMIKHYIVEKNIFVVIICKHSEQQKNWSFILDFISDCFEINGNRTIKMPKKGEYIKFKKFGRKMKSLFIIYADFEIILGPKIMESKIQMSLILTNIKNVLLVVMVIN